MLDNILYKGQLYVFGIGYNDFLTSLAIVQGYGLVGEDREAELSLVSNQFDAVCAGTLVRNKAPRTASCKSVGKLEGGADGIFCLIQSASVAAETVGVNNWAEELL